jgi:arsenate reductase
MIKSVLHFHSIENEIRSFQFGNMNVKTILQPLIDFIQEKVDKEQEIDLTLFVHTIQGEFIGSGHKRATHFHVKRCFAIQATGYVIP